MVTLQKDENAHAVEPGHGADALQPTLLRRSGFRALLMPSVRGCARGTKPLRPAGVAIMPCHALRAVRLHTGERLWPPVQSTLPQ